jgi:multidrug efflux pump subunit AcrA (membrane-fusion protein)
MDSKTFVRYLAAGLLLGLICLTGTACGAVRQNQNAPLPTLVLDSAGSASSTPAPAVKTSGSTVVASGNIIAAKEVNLAVGASGTVLEVSVQPGDKVTKGQILARLAGSERLTAALESARLELLSAQQARNSLDDTLTEARAAAQLRLARANVALDDAQKQRLWRQYRNGSDSMIAAAQADLLVAKDRLEKAQEAYDSASPQADDSVIKAGALSALSAAMRAHDRAVANLDYLTAMPSPLEVARVEAELVVAQTEAVSAQAQFEKLRNGPDVEAVSLADERIKNAQAQVDAAQAALVTLQVMAPVDGTVGEVLIQAGEWAQTGQPLLVLVDLEHLNVETSDLSERDVARVVIGQTVTVTVKALGVDVKGHVIQISPLANTLGGDVVYTTTIALDSVPAGLLPGMSVDARFESSK